MASSDSKSAFRLPWQSGHASETDSETTGTAVVDPPPWPSHDLARRQGPGSVATAAGTAETASAGETAPADATSGSVDRAMNEGWPGTGQASTTTPTAEPTDETEATDETAAVATHPDGGPRETAASPAASDAAPAGATADLRGRKPTKFLADLTRAMRLAADESRQATLTQFQADVTRHVESARTAAEAAAARARRRADDDMSSLREWSKTEIARIKQEAEDGTARRRERLESELADQTAGLELELERVQGQVRAFEAEMEGFFQRLAREEDPAQFAAMAEQLPDPPSFDTWAPEVTIALTTPEPSATAAGPEGAALAKREPEMVATGRLDGTTAMGSGGAAMAALPDEVAMGPATTGAEAHDREDAADATIGDAADGMNHGMPPMQDGDFAAAEAEAAADWQASDSAEGAGQTATDASGESDAAGSPWPTPQPVAPAPTSGATRTQIAVVGLVSVASIATFKRLLSRAPGIHSVQVASGPDGEFVFSATHDQGCDVAAVVASLQGFEVQVVDLGPGVVNARAVDPEVV